MEAWNRTRVLGVDTELGRMGVVLMGSAVHTVTQRTKDYSRI